VEVRGGGIIANLHDVVIILGFFAFFQWEFSLSVLAAVLAVLGYSVNESVVIFDRIREAFRVPQDEHARGDRPRHHQHHEPHHHHPRLDADDGAVDAAVRRPTLHYFAVALTIGILFGIYSSVFVAAAIAMWLGVKREDLVKTTARARPIPTTPTPARWCRHWFTKRLLLDTVGLPERPVRVRY
jgi:preprotein translocase subunit SecF